MACTCISLVNEELQKCNQHLVVAWTVPSGTERIVVQTAKNDRRKGHAPSLFATFCPFCGILYRAEPDIDPTPENPHG
jgi:hypothetical protein